MKCDIYKFNGSKTKSQVSFNEKLYNNNYNEHNIYLSINSELAAMRQGTHKSKSKSEVKGSGAKPWKQKGTGRARVGIIRNPSRVHGGTAFGPEPRKYNRKVNKKVKNLSRVHVFSDKLINRRVIIVEEYKFDTPSTKSFVKFLSDLKIDGHKTLCLTEDISDGMVLSCRNLYNVALIKASCVSCYDLLDCEYIIIDKKGVDILKNQFEEK